MGVIIRDVLEKYYIKYFIAFGTLLGAVRHNGFIPWDDDFDFFIFDEDYDYAMEILRKELPENLFLEDMKSEPLYFHGWSHIKDNNSVCNCTLFPQDGLYAHKGISVDLYRLFKVKESKIDLFRNQQHLLYLERKINNGIMAYSDCRDTYENLRSKIAKEEGNCCESDVDIYTYPSASLKNFILPKEIFPLKRYEFEGFSFYGPGDAVSILKRWYGQYMTLPPEDKRIPHYSDVSFL